jgi:hypothetical protein
LAASAAVLSRNDHRHLTANNISRQLWQSVSLAFRPTVLDHEILTLDIAGLCQASPKGHQPEILGVTRLGAEPSDHRHRLLRPSRQRPRGRRAAKQSDELTPFQLIELHSVPASRAKLQDIELAKNSQRVSER